MSPRKLKSVLRMSLDKIRRRQIKVRHQISHTPKGITSSLTQRKKKGKTGVTNFTIRRHASNKEIAGGRRLSIL